MKRIGKRLLLAVFCLMLSGITALAAEDVSGIYGIQINTGYTLKAPGGTNGVRVDGVGTVYPTEKLILTTKNADSELQYLVIVLRGSSTEPTEDNIVYIDQNDTGNFTIYPNALEDGETYRVYMYSSEESIGKIGQFAFYKESVPGDVNLDGKLNASDAGVLLLHAANVISFNEKQQAIANRIIGGGYAAKASIVLQYLVGERSELHY